MLIKNQLDLEQLSREELLKYIYNLKATEAIIEQEKIRLYSTYEFHKKLVAFYQHNELLIDKIRYAVKKEREKYQRDIIKILDSIEERFEPYMEERNTILKIVDFLVLQCNWLACALINKKVNTANIKNNYFYEKYSLLDKQKFAKYKAESSLEIKKYMTTEVALNRDILDIFISKLDDINNCAQTVFVSPLMTPPVKDYKELTDEFLKKEQKMTVAQREESFIFKFIKKFGSWVNVRSLFWYSYLDNNTPTIEKRKERDNECTKE